MQRRLDLLTGGERATTWEVTVDELLTLMANAVGSPERYRERREWVERNVPPERPTYIRLLLRNKRSWPAAYPEEPDFCWRLQALVVSRHRGTCSFLFDVFDVELDRLPRPQGRRRTPRDGWAELMGAADFQ